MKKSARPLHVLMWQHVWEKIETHLARHKALAWFGGLALLAPIGVLLRKHRNATDHAARLLNMGIRLGSLATKLVLTLYITRELDLSAMGNYGLVTGSVMILQVVLGLGLNFVVTRELVGATPLAALTLIRDQSVVYLFNQALLAVGMIILVETGVTGIGPKLMAVIFLLSVLESLGDATFQNVISLGKPLIANMLFFIRTAFWIFPAVAIGLLEPQFRNIQTVLISWILGSAGSLVLALYLWRGMPWRQMLNTPVDLGWIKKSIKSSYLIWLGALGSIATLYNDRFVLAHNMTLELVGVATFYGSFGGSVFAMIHSGVLSFACPKLITLYRHEDKAAYYREVRNLAWNVAVLAGILAAGVGIILPKLGYYLSRPELTNHQSTLWLILFGTWIACNGETLFYILYSRHQDKAVWLGDILALVPSVGGNLVLVPLMGFSGIGYSAIISQLFLLVWRGWYVYNK